MLGIIAVFTMIAFFELPGLIRRKYWREVIAFSLLLFLGFVLYTLRHFGVKFPSITRILIDLIQPILPGWISK